MRKQANNKKCWKDDDKNGVLRSLCVPRVFPPKRCSPFSQVTFRQKVCLTAAKRKGTRHTRRPWTKTRSEGSNIMSTASPEKESAQQPPAAAEFEPPLACVRRILKNTLPSSTNVGKDASAAFARASGIFIIYLTACANDFAREHKRQTITANDVLAAIKVSCKDPIQGAVPLRPSNTTLTNLLYCTL